MKKYLFLISMLFVMVATFAQTGKKPPVKEKPPTQKKVNEVEELQKEMDELSPEEKKEMEKMGFKMPDMKNKGISDAQLKKAYEDDNRIVPLKDVARITTALAVTLTNAGISAYINKTHQAVLSKLSSGAKSKGEEILQQILKLKSSVANTAVGLWMDGKPTLALYLMGAACKTDPANTNNLNNYASFLTMCGAEQMALPILSNLNKRYPQNNTILNNIAQAWLGLGDIPRAEKYADSTIRIYAAHPQANMAKCLIEESKGNIPAAIAAAKKSIKEAYSTEKENKLNKLGYDIKSDDLNWDRPMPQDALGLAKFTWPNYPLNVEENKLLEFKWRNFIDDCQGQIDGLKIKQERLEQEYETITGLRYQQVLQASKNGQYAQLIPGYAAKAIKKLGPGVNDINGNITFIFSNAVEPILDAVSKVEHYEKKLADKQEVFKIKYKDKIGEGKENPLKEMCEEENAIRTEFLKSANGVLQSGYREYLEYTRRRTSELLYYYQYTMWPEQFELMKVNAQIAWLNQIKAQGVLYKDKSGWCNNEKPEFKKSGALQNFDDVHCEYVSTVNLGVYKITSSCSNLTGEFDFGGVKINVKDNVETDKYSWTAIVGVSKSVGPMGLKGKVTVGVLVEGDNSGTTDYGGVAGVSVKSGPVTITGIEVTATVNSGVSTSGKGILGGQK